MFRPAIIIDMRRAAVLGRMGYHDRPPRLAIFLARFAAWCAIGSVAAVLAIPVLTVLDLLTH